MIYYFIIMTFTRKELQQIYKDTKKCVDTQIGLKGSYKQSTRYACEELPEYDEIMEITGGVPDTRPEVIVVNSDTLDEAVKLVEDGFTPLVLNLASERQPGGGVEGGYQAQEEDIFRRSNYMSCTNKQFYPLGPEECVVTEGVVVFKDADYQKMSNGVVMDFIAMPGVRNPPIARDDGVPSYRNEEDDDLMCLKIDMIFRYATLQSEAADQEGEYDSLVLGALGCGAFHNPTERVCEIFQEAVLKYGPYFKKIVFAVMSSGNNSNFEVFSKRF